MRLPFTKMHGLGNDFIVVDCRNKSIPEIGSVMASIGDRRFGIGFDQALILKKSRKADFKMEIYNSDGGKVEMCGNGIRCLAVYIWKRRLSQKSVLEIETMAGIIRPESDPKHKDLVRVDMGEPVTEGRKIPVRADGIIKNRPIKVGGKSFKVTCVSMGNPHAVVVVKDLDKCGLEKYGPLLEKNAFFPQRVNVEFIEVVSKSRIKMRVWERGAGETLACGTGACASVVAANSLGLTGRKVRVDLLGGPLHIELSPAGAGKGSRVYMTGPAVEVFTGTVDL